MGGGGGGGSYDGRAQEDKRNVCFNYERQLKLGNPPKAASSRISIYMKENTDWTRTNRFRAT